VPARGPRPRASPPGLTDHIIEPAREVAVVHRTYVLVVGAGPSGLAASLAAARAGADVALVERFGCLPGRPAPLSGAARVRAYQGSVRGRPKRASTPVSPNRVSAEILSPSKLTTSSPLKRATGACASSM
jgi:hypothetical protein